MAEHKLRCGDTVSQEGLDYKLEIAYADYETGRASWCGWPEGSVEIKALELFEACTDEEHRKAVSMWLDRPQGHDRDHRRNDVERLYRPRAFWTSVRASRRVQVEEALAGLSTAESMLREAQNGPPDVEPLQPPAAVRASEEAT